MKAPIQFGVFCCCLAVASCTGRAVDDRQAGVSEPAAAELAASSVPREDGSDTMITIGLSVATDTFIIERWNKDIKIFTGAARELGADVIVQMSAGGTKEQIARINFMLDQHIDVLVVIAHDTDMLAGVVKQVRDSGVPVIAYDRMIQGVPIDAYASFDNREVGRLCGKALAAAVPRGRYLIVNGSVRDNNSYEVSYGLHEILNPFIKEGLIEIEEELWLEEWSFDEALARIGSVLDRTTDIDAISCGNDQIATAAIQQLSERRLAGKVAVVGQDADLINCQRVVEGTQLMTVYKPIAKLASRAAELAVSIARGKSIPNDTLLDNKSGAAIPSYIEKPIAVQKSNMDRTVIMDSFHSWEDVYRNFIRR